MLPTASHPGQRLIEQDPRKHFFHNVTAIFSFVVTQPSVRIVNMRHWFRIQSDFLELYPANVKGLQTSKQSKH